MFGNYAQLIEKIDRHGRAIHRRWGRHMACGKGCRHCCQHIAVFPVEAAYLAGALERMDAGAAAAIRDSARRAITDGPCPILDTDGACRLYDARPVICRTQGLPLLIRQDGDTRIDFCPLNFKDFTRFPADIVTDLDRLNDMLAAVNALFVRHLPADRKVPGRILLAEAILTPVVGIDR